MRLRLAESSFLEHRGGGECVQRISLRHVSRSHFQHRFLVRFRTCRFPAQSSAPRTFQRLPTCAHRHSRHRPSCVRGSLLQTHPPHPSLSLPVQRISLPAFPSPLPCPARADAPFPPDAPVPEEGSLDPRMERAGFLPPFLGPSPPPSHLVVTHRTCFTTRQGEAERNRRTVTSGRKDDGGGRAQCALRDVKDEHGGEDGRRDPARMGDAGVRTRGRAPGRTGLLGVSSGHRKTRTKGQTNVTRFDQPKKATAMEHVGKR